MKIGLYLGLPPEAGGAHQYARTMLQALEQLERESLLSLTVAWSHPCWRELLAHRPAARTLPVRRGFFDKLRRAALLFGFSAGLLRAVLRLLPGEHRRLDAAGCDLWVFPGQETLACALRSRTVTVIHDLMHIYERRFPESGSCIEYWRRQNHYRAVCRHAAAIVVDSATGRQQVMECYGAPEEKIFELPYAARQPEPVAPARLAGFLASVGVPAGRYFYYPAQFWRHKNHVRLIEAFDRIGPAENNLWLILPGSPRNAMDEVKAAAQRARHPERIVLPGFLEDELVAALYQEAIALVMPTFYGPTNIPPLEAMVRGCPMALSGIYGMREQSGAAALYFDPESVDDMARCLDRLHREPGLRRTLVDNARELAPARDFATFTRNLSAILARISRQAAFPRQVASRPCGAVVCCRQFRTLHAHPLRLSGEMMRLLLLCKRYYTSKDLIDDRFGRLYHLPVELARRGHEVEVLALDYRHFGATTRVFEGVGFTTLPASPLALPLLPLRLRAWLRGKHFDTVIASGDSHLGYLGLRLARALGARFAFDVYDYYPTFPLNRLPGMKPMFTAAVRAADLLLCASHPLMQRLQPLNARQLLVENGVDRRLFRPKPAERASGAGPVIGYFGSVTPGRGPLLIEACRRLREQHPGLRLLLAGVQIDVALDEPWIDYRGALPQAALPGLIAGCDVITVPYASTPFNDMSGACKIAEYLACAKPIVATRIAGHEAVLGRNARGLCEQDAEDMARAITRQLEAPEILPFPASLDWSAIAAQLEAALAEAQRRETRA